MAWEKRDVDDSIFNPLCGNYSQTCSTNFFNIHRWRQSKELFRC